MQTKFEKQANSFVAMGLVTKSDNGYTVNTPATWGKFNSYEVVAGKCECFNFETSGDCVHALAAEMMEAKENEKFCQGNINPTTGRCDICEPDTNEIEALKNKVAEILQSEHVQAVEVALEESFGNVRVYSAITKDKGVPHIYTVRVEDSFEFGEKVTTGGCNCPAGAKRITCRHIVAVAEKDAVHCSREIYPNEIAQYRAHKKVKANAAFEARLEVEAANDDLNRRLAKLNESNDRLAENVAALAREWGVESACSCKWNWDDKFIESYCPTHEAEQADAAAEYQWSIAA